VYTAHNSDTQWHIALLRVFYGLGFYKAGLGRILGFTTYVSHVYEVLLTCARNNMTVKTTAKNVRYVVFAVKCVKTA